ncbi:MAG TPA: ribonuclease HII [Acidobacteriaceae bacterium]|nr:ribonuclease HII [Acidobacteriaceae bacterium]
MKNQTRSADEQKPLSKQAEKMRRLRALICGDKYERAARQMGATVVAGVDEVGRGSLFGPVVAAAVILPEKTRIRGIRDSKQLLPEERERLDIIIRRKAIAVAIGFADAATVDAINIRRASHLAMLSAIAQLLPQPDFLLIDAERLDTPCMQKAIIYGDSISVSIAAASIVAKVYRDAWMCRYHEEYPQYGLASHKGYSTEEHLRALAEHGPCPLHRMTYEPVRRVLELRTGVVTSTLANEPVQVS